ncbi:MAG: A/G-specific adenine glycosylase [Armatimonadota bacterium]
MDDFPLAERLLDWYATAKREMPWRGTRDPYAIWISEMMLQQTQVATATPYWLRWMERFPTVQALADAPIDAVLAQWQGLGYYARARNLHAAARRIAGELGGVFPNDVEGLLRLPGIGRYTAGAIASIAFGADTPVVDANVVRVLCRLDGIAEAPKGTAVQERLWNRAAQLLPRGRAGDFNQAMMELGALVCQPNPRCAACPWQEACVARKSGAPQDYPAKAPRPTFTQHRDACAVVRRDGRVLLTRRPLDGLWGGLWELPRVEAQSEETVEMAARRACLEVAGLSADTGLAVATVRHGVTTRRITLTAVECTVEGSAEATPIGCSEVAWAGPDERAAFPLSSPQARIWKAVFGDV